MEYAMAMSATSLLCHIITGSPLRRIGARLGASGRRPLRAPLACGGALHDLVPKTEAFRYQYKTTTEARKRSGPSDLTAIITTAARGPPRPAQPRPTGHKPPLHPK